MTRQRCSLGKWVGAVFRGSRKTVVVLMLVVVGILAVGGGWLGVGLVTRTRAESATTAAADLIRAGRGADTVLLDAVLPPEFSADMRDGDYDALFGYFGSEWKHVARDAADGIVVDTYVAADGSGASQECKYRVKGDTTLTRATVRLEYRADSNEIDGKATVDLAWIDGAWRVVRYEYPSLETVLVFQDPEADSGELVEEMISALESANTDVAAPATGQTADDGVAQLTEEELNNGELPEGHPSIASPTSGVDKSTPEGYVSGYFDAVIAADYALAFALLPADKQASYGDQSAFAAQLEGYGITAYTIDRVEEDQASGAVTVLSTAVTAGGSFQYEWTLEPGSDGWVAIDRALAGMN